MGTRSTIAIKTEEGKLRTIYCHWDGYVDHNGRILLNNYTTPEKVKALIDLGDLSQLSTEVGDVRTFGIDGQGEQPELPMFGNWCTAYHRDRGEDWTNVAPQTFDNAQEMVEHYAEAWCEFFYIFNGQDWLVSNGKKDAKGYPIFDYVEVAILEEIVG